jgi:hypothetical protein
MISLYVISMMLFQLHASYDVELDKIIINLVSVRNLEGGRLIMLKATITAFIWRGQWLHGYFNDAFVTCIGRASSGRIITN